MCLSVSIFMSFTVFYCTSCIAFFLLLFFCLSVCVCLLFMLMGRVAWIKWNDDDDDNSKVKEEFIFKTSLLGGGDLELDLVPLDRGRRLKKGRQLFWGIKCTSKQNPGYAYVIFISKRSAIAEMTAQCCVCHFLLVSNSNIGLHPTFPTYRSILLKFRFRVRCNSLFNTLFHGNLWLPNTRFFGLHLW